MVHCYSQYASFEDDDRHWSNGSTGAAPDKGTREVGNAALRLLSGWFVHAYMHAAYKEEDAEVTGDMGLETGNTVAVLG